MLVLILISRYHRFIEKERKVDVVIINDASGGLSDASGAEELRKALRYAIDKGISYRFAGYGDELDVLNK